MAYIRLKSKFSCFGILFYATCIVLGSCHRDSRENLLISEIEHITKDFKGKVGLYVAAINGDEIVSIHADSVFPTASLIKVPILCALWSKIYSGELNPDSLIHFYPDSLHYPWKGEDALARFAPGEDLSIRQLMTHMITFSDNHASLYLQEVAGGGIFINAWLAKEGFDITRVNSRTLGRDSAYARFGWGQTSPREMAGLLIRLRKGEIINSAVSEAIYRHLTRSYWNGEALSQIPPGIQVASKQGAVDESRSEVVLVNAPHGDYVFCIITSNQKDTGWTYENEGWVLIRSISALLWKYFEPGLPYSSPLGMDKYLP